MHRRLGEHLAKTPLAKGSPRRSWRGTSRAATRSEAAAVFYLEAAGAARDSFQTQLAIRYYQRALALLPATTRAGSSRTRRSRPSTARSAGAASGASTCSRCARSRASSVKASGWRSRSCAPRASISTRDFLARGLPIAERAEEVARAAKAAELEVEAQSILSELLRELGDVQGALAACDRALEVVAARRGAAPRQRRGACRRARRSCGARARARGGRVLRRGHRRRFGVAARAGKRRAPRTRSPSPCSCSSASRTPSRSRSRRSASTSRSAAASRSPRRSPTSAERTRASAISRAPSPT